MVDKELSMADPKLFPSSTSSLNFPAASQNLSSILRSLRHSALSIPNRLASINEDSTFVQLISERYNLPLVANERCGSWYIPPEKKIGSVYFKSTDGHAGQWSFSLRRLNLQILPLIAEHGG
jgi:tRNA A64-2'-O-ribosylphosphate transferase